MLRLKISDTVLVPVAGSIPDEHGKPAPFSFTLKCKRYGSDKVREIIEDKDRLVDEIVRDVVEGWDGVTDADGQPMEFTRPGLDELLRIAGMSGVIYMAYLNSVGAKGKAKN